jgi:hypothetical protein
LHSLNHENRDSEDEKPCILPEAIGFLAEHTWLLILAAVAFLFEKYVKKRR